MKISGSCDCGNISLSWQNSDFSLVARACNCNYCQQRSLAWLSKSGTRVSVAVRKPELLQLTQNGSGQARFYECAFCQQTCLASVVIEEAAYAAINLACLTQASRFPNPAHVDNLGRSDLDKLERWRQNWCDLLVKETPPNILF